MNIYEEARNKAWEFLIQNKINSLPISISDICRSNDIRLLRDTKEIILPRNIRGGTFLHEGNYFIVVRGSDSLQAQRYTAAHELGHIWLEHPMTDSKYGRTFSVSKKDPIEYQAERFAIDILAPACILWAIGLRTPEEIAAVCNISPTAARYRAERMSELYARNAFLLHPLEREVHKQFKVFIEKAQ